MLLITLQNKQMKIGKLLEEIYKIFSDAMEGVKFEGKKQETGKGICLNTGQAGTTLLKKLQ